MNYKFLIFSLLMLFITIGCGSENSSDNNQSSNNENSKIENAVPVEAMEVNERIIEQTLELTGILIPNNSVDIVAEVSGEVIEVYKELGEYVNKNQTLALIDGVILSSQLEQAKAQVLSTESNLQIAEANLKSDKILYENGDISEFEYNNSESAHKNAEAQHLAAKAALDAAQKTFEDTRIRTPISGFISRKNISFGSMVMTGTVAYRVVDLSSLKIKVSVPQEVINNVKIGGDANVIISALNGRSFPGKVRRISPQADEITGGFAIEVEVYNKENLIKAGMTAKIELLLTKGEKVLAIPEYAVVLKSDENYVYKIINNIAELIKVDLGESVGENIIVNGGLNTGDKIVIVGMKNLGTKTKVYIEKLLK